jgi:hypothetical protein
MRRGLHALELGVMMVSGSNGIQPNPTSPTVPDVVVAPTRLAIVLTPAELPAGGGNARVMIETTGGVWWPRMSPCSCKPPVASCRRPASPPIAPDTRSSNGRARAPARSRRRPASSHVDGDSLPEHTEPSPVVTYAAGTYTAFLEV